MTGRNNLVVIQTIPFIILEKSLYLSQLLAWAWLAKPKANVVIPKYQPLPKYLREKTSKSAKYNLPLRYKKDPLK